MHWPGFTKAVCLAAVAATVLASSSGCVRYRPRYGVILRGDWSLEMNRVPWLGNRTQAYEEATQGSCEPAASCEAVEPAPALNSNTVPTSCDGTASSPSESYQTCGLGARFLGGRLLARPALPVQTTAPARFPRFHPVPTQPVFSRSELASTEPAGAAAPADAGGHPAPLPPATFSGRKGPAAIPTPVGPPPPSSGQKGPEAIPTPAGQPAAAAGGGGAQAGSWVFRPAQRPTEKSPGGRGPKVASSGGSEVTR